MQGNNTEIASKNSTSNENNLNVVSSQVILKEREEKKQARLDHGPDTLSAEDNMYVVVVVAVVVVVVLLVGGHSITMGTTRKISQQYFCPAEYTLSLNLKLTLTLNLVLVLVLV